MPLLLPAVSRPRRRHARATGATRTRRPGPTAAGTRPTSGTVLCGVFRGAGVTVPKGVCVRLGDSGELGACFNPETLCYEALWHGGFVKFSAVRHGFLDGLILDGTALAPPEGTEARAALRLSRLLSPRQARDLLLPDRRRRIPRLALGRGRQVHAAGRPGQRPSRWPARLAAARRSGRRCSTTRGTLGTGRPYAIDTIEPPFENPWKALLFFGDHDFLPDGSAMLCTMQGDVWHVDGLDASLDHVRWRRFASGLHQALGLVVADGKVHVLGRDQITRLHDLNGDGEADFYECVSNAYATSPAGHDFICGLQRDAAGQLLHRLGQAGAAADLARRQAGRGRWRPAFAIPTASA